MILLLMIKSYLAGIYCFILVNQIIGSTKVLFVFQKKKLFVEIKQKHAE
jgi:hypothetical protein